MKKITFILILVFITSYTFAQVVEVEENLKKKVEIKDEGWKTKGAISLNIAQTSLTNWAAGGLNSFSLNGFISYSAKYKKGNNSWDNNFDMGYGILRQGTKDAITFQKTDDKIDFSSKFGRKINDKLYYAALLSFKTQMTEGYDYPNDSVIISSLFAPAYFVGALGIDYKPSEKFSAFIAPFTSKTTFVNNQTLANAGAFGVDAAVLDANGNITTPGANIRNEFGGYVKFMYENDIMKNIKLNTKLDFFSNYLETPQNIDINWEVLISMKVNKFISASISTQLIYDDDVKIAVDRNDDGIMDGTGPRIQFKELIGVGFSFQF